MYFMALNLILTIIEKQELDEYTSLALHSYRQVINWLKKKATNEIQIRAGI